MFLVCYSFKHTSHLQVEVLTVHNLPQKFIFISLLFFPFQIHFVFFNSKYGRLKDALQKPDGITVVAFFVDVSGFLAYKA